MNFDENQIIENKIKNVSPYAEIQNPIGTLNPEILSEKSEEQNPKIHNLQSKIKENLAQEIQTLDYLIQRGMVNPQQGLKMLCERVNEARQQCSQENNTDTKSNLDSIEFFQKPEYKDVLEYLKSTNTNFETGDISKITEIMKSIEQNAIDRYLRNKDYEEKVTAENELAKQKLSSNAKREGIDYSAPIFTRETIGKMSSKEFVKNEKAIMDQLRRGLIR